MYRKNLYKFLFKKYSFNFRKVVKFRRKFRKYSFFKKNISYNFRKLVKLITYFSCKKKKLLYKLFLVNKNFEDRIKQKNLKKELKSIKNKLA